MFSHSLFKALKSFEGNARACVYTEPMWGIPYNLYAPYISVYMMAFGLKDSQIGLISTIGLCFQIFAAMMSGIITDKLGRKRATLIFDILAWSVPTLIWAIAQNFAYFVAAAIVNSLWKLTSNSWTCLMVEDADPKQLVDLYTWVYIAGLLSAFFAPLAGLLIQSFTLVPTMRGLYLFACVMMTAKFFVLNHYVKETKQGQVRMQETRDQSILVLLTEYREVIGQILKAPLTLYTLGIMLVLGTSQMINGTFWSIIVTTKLMIPAEHLSIYAFGRSIVMLVFFFAAMPTIREMRFRNPMLVGFAGLALSAFILITIPERSYLLLFLSTVIEACSYATLGTQVDRMIVVTVDAKERARIMALLYVAVILFTSPFGWIAGTLSEINRNLPFILIIVLLAIGAVLVYLASRHSSSLPEPEPAEAVPSAS